MAGAPSDGDDRRNVPRSWEGMLKFCLENTSEDAGSQAKPMDEEVCLFINVDTGWCYHSSYFVHTLCSFSNFMACEKLSKFAEITHSMSHL